MVFYGTFPFKWLLGLLAAYNRIKVPKGVATLGSVAFIKRIHKKVFFPRATQFLVKDFAIFHAKNKQIYRPQKAIHETTHFTAQPTRT